MPEAPETKFTFCRICEASCGLEVDVADDRIVDIRPDKAHEATEGYACIKGLHQHQMYFLAILGSRPMLYPGRHNDHFTRAK